MTASSNKAEQMTSQPNHYERRHSRWYEMLLLSKPLQIIIGLAITCVLPALVIWEPTFWQRLTPVRTSTLITNAIAFCIAFWVLYRMGKFTAGYLMAHIMPVVTVVFLLSFSFLLLSRTPYSRSVLLSAYVLTLAWCYIGYFIGKRYRRLKFAVLPLEKHYALETTDKLEIRYLETPHFNGCRYDAIVADFRGKKMTPEWERFLAECILAHIPVYHVRQVTEGIAGRVQIDHLSENAAGALMPSQLYSAIKRLIDIVGVVLVLPLVLPVMLLTAIAIKLDSKGPAIFSQERVGMGNRNFQVHKFRSMAVDGKADSTRDTADGDDHRITRVGHFIRKTRIDELPQLWNILKGEMSWIGPRPEWRLLAEKYNHDVPFYNYRHVVRPGISGWAQVMQGYAWDADATKVKIQYDFYYIKHFSFWLDVLIVLKTLKVIVSGWGAR